MMLVRTRVAPSAIHGLGLFALGVIPKGAPVWRFEPGFDREFSPEEFAALPTEAQEHIRWFAYVNRDTGGRVLSGDHTCFMNHSPAPTTGASLDAVPAITPVAVREIGVGVVVTGGEGVFDAEAGTQLGGGPEGGG